MKMEDNQRSFLIRKVSDLKYEIGELEKQIQFSKENELKEFVHELYHSIKNNKNKDIDELKYLKEYIENFCKDNNLYIL